MNLERIKRGLESDDFVTTEFVNKYPEEIEVDSESDEEEVFNARWNDNMESFSTRL